MNCSTGALARLCGQNVGCSRHVTLCHLSFSQGPNLSWSQHGGMLGVRRCEINRLSTELPQISVCHSGHMGAIGGFWYLHLYIQVYSGVYSSTLRDHGCDVFVGCGWWIIILSSGDQVCG